MRRRAILGVIAILVFVLTVAGSALAVLAKHVPAFYERTTLAADDQPAALARDFYARSMDLFNKVGGDRPWEQQFTQEQLNGYFHVAFENDLIRVGFRYGEGDWSCIISVEFRVWLTKKTNVIALELCDFRAGALPLGTRTLIDFITEAARRQNIDVTWFRRAGHPIALLRLQANQPRPTFTLRRLEVNAGKFVVASSPMREPSGPASPPLAAAPKPPDPGTALPTH
jgi:hypothetical protein